MVFVPKPEPHPMIVMVEKLKVCSYLGDYGAGKTLKTFSLLPGEKTEIAIKTYKHKESTSSKAENVLDSFSSNSADTLESQLQNEQNSTNSSEETDTNNFTTGWKLDADMNFKIGLGAKFSATNTGTITNNATTNSVRTNAVKALNSAMNKHTRESSSNREVDVNTEVTESYKEGEEVSTTRTLENINHSRVLNFVFRQLLQEYISITYLDSVSFVYSNGFPETKRVVGLDGLPDLLREVLPTEEKVQEVLCYVIKELRSVYDYQGEAHQFIEQVSERVMSCDFSNDEPTGEVNKYLRKRKGLTQEYIRSTNGVDQPIAEVPGIILDVSNRILRTDSVIVDALLGQGQALDCFNLKLQEAAGMKTFLENFSMYMDNLVKSQNMTQNAASHGLKIDELKLALKVIGMIEDPVQQAEMFKKVFGACCDKSLLSNEVIQSALSAFMGNNEGASESNYPTEGGENLGKV